MKCAEVEIRLCDYLDGALAPAQRGALDRHLADCAACAELARDAAAAVSFLNKVEAVEPPPELVTRILFHTPAASPAPSRQAGVRVWLTGWMQPILQPRFAMGMAMTILSFSMVGRFANIPQRQLSPADLNPVKVWAALDDRLHRTWDRAVKSYENLRLVYEIQSRLKEWTEQEESERRSHAAGSIIEPASRPGPSSTPTTGAGDPR